MVDSHDIRGFPGPHPRGGVVSAFGVGHLSRFSRRSNASSVRPTSRAHCASVWVRPSNVNKWLLLLLLACWSRSAQQQFSWEYGPSRSLRSKVWARLGFGPMSAKNASNPCQRASKVMPRPPYRLYDLCFGLVHLVFISAHALYSGISSSFDFAISEHSKAWLASQRMNSAISTPTNGS